MTLEEIDAIHSQIEALQAKLSDEQDRRKNLADERAKKMKRVKEIRDQLCSSSFPSGWHEAIYFPNGAEYFRYCDDTMKALRWNHGKGWIEFEPEDFLN